MTHKNNQSIKNHVVDTQKESVQTTLNQVLLNDERIKQATKENVKFMLSYGVLIGVSE